MTMRHIAAAIAVIAGFLIALSLAAGFAVDWLWFSTLGYFGVFLTIFGAKAALFFAVFAASAILLWLNGFLAYRLAGHQAHPGPGLSPWDNQTLTARLANLSPNIPRRSLIAGGAAVLAGFIALGETSNWDVVLRFIGRVPYGQSDPLYEKDIGFYLFLLPAYIALKNWMLITLAGSALVAGAVYWARGSLVPGKPFSVPSFVIAHGSVLLGFFFAVKAWSYWLDRYLLLYSNNGVVVGAAYVDVHIVLPALLALAGLATAAALASLANVWVKSYKLPMAGAVLVLGGSFVMATAFPALFQRIYVKPNELRLETPYLERNISLTREAYKLRQIAVKPFKHTAVGLAATHGHLCAAAGDPDLLQVPRCGHRSL